MQGCDLECLSLGWHPLLLCDDFHRPGTWEGLLNPLQQWSLEALKFTHFSFLAMEKKSFGKGECSVSFNSLVLTQFKQQHATVSASLNFSFLPLCFSSPFSVPYSVDKKHWSQSCVITFSIGLLNPGTLPRCCSYDNSVSRTGTLT